MARLAALVPKPRVNLTRYHGVFAPNSRHRAQVTPAGRGKKSLLDTAESERHIPMAWAQRLKRVFKIDIEVCEHCGGKAKDAARKGDNEGAMKLANQAKAQSVAGVLPR